MSDLRWAQGKSKSQFVREVLRRRKLDELPPVFPNGWFALLESDELKVEKVKYVTAVGMLLLLVYLYSIIS